MGVRSRAFERWRGGAWPREALLIGAGLVAALLLVSAGLQSAERARWRGAEELERRAAEARRRIEAEARALLERERAPPGARFEFALELGRAAAGPASEQAPFPAAGWSDFDLGLSALQTSREAAELRLAQLEALLAGDPAAPRRGEGLLLALQLAAASGQGEPVARWLEAALELSPDLAHEGHSTLVLCLLAAADLGPAALLERGAERALAALAEGSLAWPGPQDAFEPQPAPETAAEGPIWRPDPRPALLCERLERLLGPQSQGRLAATLAQLADPGPRQARAFQAGGPLPAEIAADGAAPQAPQRWLPLEARGPGWWWRGRGSLPVQIAWWAQTALLEPLERAAAEDGSGFVLATGPGPAGADSALARPLDLPLELGLDLGPGLRELRLAHPDPAQWQRRALAQSRPLQAGAYGLSVLVLAAAVLLARTLAKERRLAELERRFVAGISHDLRTPLASILLMSEGLAAGQVPPEAQRQRYFPALRREAERLRRRVDDLLDFSRLRRGLGPRLNPEPVRLAPLAQELEAELRGECERAGVALEFEARGLPEELVLDADALRRALGNLVQNALRHAGSPSLEVRLFGRPGGLDLEVADRGRGIPADQRERAFLPFVQLAGTRSEQGGSGLGLSIVRELARAHGGDARLLDPAGPGTRIRLSFEELEPA